MQLLLKPDFLNFSHVMRTNQSKFSKFGRWKFIDHRFFFLFFRGIPLEETSSHDYDKLVHFSSKASFRNKSVQKGTRRWVLSPQHRTKKPLISWFNEHGHPAHHHSFFSVLDYWGSGKMTYFRAFKHIRERRFLKSKYNLVVDKIKWCLL